jgi:adenylate cyclase
VRVFLRENAFDVVLPLLAKPILEPSLVVVDVDSASLARVGPWPWPRTRLADLLNTIAEARPAAVGLDIVLEGAHRGDAGQEESGADAAVAAAVARTPTVLGFVLSDESQDDRLPRAPVLLRGQPDLPGIWSAPSVAGPPQSISAAAAGFGAAVLLPDPDGRIRRVPIFVNAGGGLRPGLAAELTRVSIGASGFVIDAAPRLARIGPLTVALEDDGQLRLLPLGDEIRRRRTVSAADVLGDPGTRARLAGQVVLIGSGAPEVGGLRVTATSAAMPSVQFQADAAEMIVRGIIPRTLSQARIVEIGAAAVLTLLGVALSLHLTPFMAALAALGAAQIWIATSAAAFAVGSLLVDPAGPAIVSFACFSLFSVATHADNVRRARALRQRFEQYLAPEVVARLVANPDLVRLEGESREITALFTDIEGFTAMTERSLATDLVALLDTYLDEITRVVIAHGGMVEKIVGDAVHAIFNAPLDLSDHPTRALNCALAILAVSEELRANPLARNLGLGRTRIGIETGVAIIGDVGGRRKLDYTAYGTVMNTAARLEAANKELGSCICIGPNAATRLDPHVIRPLATLHLRGFAEPVQVFAPLAL